MIRQRLGWIPDIPDFRDYSGETPVVRDLMAGARRRPGLPPQRAGGGGRPAGASEPLPPAVDLRSHCSPVEDQGNLGSCTANAGTGIIEYYERRAFGRHLEASRLFLYKAARNLMKISGDTGAYLRTTIGAMVLFGVPPEDYWPYDDRPDRFDREPPAFCYAFAQNYKTIRYYRHDVPGTPAGETLDRVKTHLAAGHPSMFGFTVYGSIEAAGGDGAIPFPGPRERIEGGHAVAAVGYDDRLKIRNEKNGGGETTGALLIRNSWGKGWGDGGYGWLPYAYVLRGLAEDFWSVLKKDWIDTGAFDE
ncbi:MAG TPA: C1 family peptidase [Candidatus Aminicenantes bacterium]|nr:MAG: Papain family cysteine protease [Candidatus Aminicenantes bacterium ADurb.Bin147]HPH42940.1 C1 family peptidase [Candidatus Aminicenantes bacterium]HPN17268.1 C1 family peptidase [Candidatus Aminicenantes bacterium]